ncbi:S66 family peptidase [Enterococcus wangshanyuanii]|uniref:LD-carboxypeptidase n=1 Tax=Enterococcus wangshanyuanii TaxID=2005703 RepID=A0ABQ1NUH6_9ENTE|nr:S66 peptidase family protein [Enterococcus wangshanyuanii]GGC85200.1 LD-carboxypeptidase [Enterococcus wangshanyuanii]
MKPPRLKKGDQIRVVAPSSSFARLNDFGINLAEKKLTELGFIVTYAEHTNEEDVLGSSSILSRVKDLHEAFLDPEVKGILTAIGGFNSNELLPYIDFELIKRHPKVLCGYSDITALCNAITTKTGLLTYVGPHFSSFQMDELQDYQTENFELATMKEEAFDVRASKSWSQDKWYLPQPKRELHRNQWKVYNQSTPVTGICYGGNLGTFQLLFGTSFLPELEQSILFVENAEENDYHDFARGLASLLQVVRHPKALLIGRFPKETGMTEERLLAILGKYPLLKEIPVIYDMNFGHTQPIFTIPIGDRVTVDTTTKQLTFF